MANEGGFFFSPSPTGLLWAGYSYIGDYQTVRRAFPGPSGIFQNVIFSINLFILFYQTAPELLRQIVIKLF
jgi:hypothetical protein